MSPERLIYFELAARLLALALIPVAFGCFQAAWNIWRYWDHPTRPSNPIPESQREGFGGLR